MSDKDSEKVVEGTTCFEQHESCGVSCQRQNCRSWFDNSETQNCVILAAKRGPQKQERIGRYFGLTRMRVCQIEKGIIKKVEKD